MQKYHFNKRSQYFVLHLRLSFMGGDANTEDEGLYSLISWGEAENE